MTSSIFNWAIDKYLSKFLSINKDETNVSLWNGSVEMSNVKIKPEIFTTMNIPYFELVNGYIGKIKIVVSLPRFYLYPIKVVVDKVFFHAKQKKLETINKKTEIENMETYKDSQLLNMEELANEVDKLNEEGGPGYLDQIINNLEIEIKDICVRFDDDLSYNLVPFTFGLLLKNLKITTVNEYFQEPPEGKTVPIGDVGRKILKMVNFSLYMDTYEDHGKLLSYKTRIVDKEETQVKDEKLQKVLGDMLDYYRYCLSETEVHINDRNSHQYLNYNSGFFIKLAMNPKLKNDAPQYYVECKLDNIILSLSLVQIKAAMKLLAYQDLNSKYQLGLSKEYYVKVLKEEEKTIYMDTYMDYFKAKYGKKKDEKQAKTLETNLKQIEKGLKYEDIQIMRDAAKYKMTHDSEIDKIDEKIQKLQGGTGFFSFFSSGPNAEQKKEIQKLQEQKNKLLNENVDEEVRERLNKVAQGNNEVDTLKDYPDTFCLYKILLTLPIFSLDINKQKDEKMISIVSNNFSVNAEMRKKGQFFSLLIDDFSVKQYQLKNNNMYETIMATIEQRDDIKKAEKQTRKGACYIEFENNPTLEKSNFRLLFRNTKRVIVTVNLYSIQFIMNKVLDSLAATISKFGSERYIGSGEIQNLIKSGFETNYISGGFQHFNIDLDIYMKSPIILYPQDIMDPNNRKCLFIKLGDFVMKSELPPRQILEKNYEFSVDRKELFDKYIMNIENFSMFTVDEFQGDFDNLVNIKGLDLVENISVDFKLEQNFEQKNKNFEKMLIDLNIGKCKFNLRDSQIVFFIELLSKMQIMNKNLAFDLEKLSTKFEKEEDKQNKEDLAKEEKEKKEKKEEKKQKEEKEKKEKEEKERRLSQIKKQEEEKKKQEEELRQRLKENEDPQYLIFNFNIKSIELCLMKSISLKERQILSDIDPRTIPGMDTQYRDYIILSLNDFLIKVITTEKGNMEVIISMVSTAIKDVETIIVSKNNPRGDILINKEFQNLIHMRAHDLERKPTKDERRFLKKRSEIFGIKVLPEEIKEKENEENKFMVIEYKYNVTNQNQEVNIVLQKIRICFSMSSMARLYQYYSYYYGMYCKSNDDAMYILAKMDEKNKKMKMKDKYNLDTISVKLNLESKISDISDDSYLTIDVNDKEELIMKQIIEKKQAKKNMYENLVEDLKKDLKPMGKEFNNIISTATTEKKNEEDDIEEIEEENKEEEKVEREKSNMKINFEMKETRLDFPMDDTQDKTKVLKFNFNFICTILMNSEYDNFKNIYGRQIRMHYLSNNMKISAKCINVGFEIINFKNGNYYTENICDKMLEGFRFYTNINSFLLLPHRDKSVMVIDVNFEPLIFNIGFRQTKTLMDFWPKLSQFLTDMYKEYVDPLKELNKEPKNEIIMEDENNIINENNIDNEDNENKININEMEVDLENLTEEEIKEREKKRKKKIEKYKIRQRILQEEKKLKEEKERQDELKVKTNIDDINSMMDVKVMFEKLSFKYLDDSGAYLIPLLNIESHDVLINYISNSNPDSIENISNLILESISRTEIELKDYDKNGLYMYVQIKFFTSINFYNDRINNWEPIIENYSGMLEVDQAASFSPMRVYFKSDDMFDINVSISSMNVLNRVLKKFSEPTEKWDEVLNQLDDIKNKDIDSKPAVEFINNSGVDIQCWIDAKSEILSKKKDKEKDKNNLIAKFLLTSNGEQSRRSISNYELSLYYQQLSAAKAKISKDKFSFKIRGYVPVYSNDFSTNYTSSFRLKKSKKAYEDIRYIYTNMKEKKKQNQIIDEDDEKNNAQRSNSLVISEILEEEDQQTVLSDPGSEDNLTTSNKKSQEGMKEKNIELEESKQLSHNLIEDEIEILVKVRQNGPIKNVIFESNVFIFNNLQIPIYLSFISPEDFVNKYGGKDSNINHSENKDKVLLNTCKKLSININYIINKYRVYVSFYNKLNEKDNNFVLLYENFSLLKLNLPSFMKFNEENSPGFEGYKKTVLEDKYSKIVEINQNNNQFYISCNLLIQKGGGDIIKDMPNILENANSYINIDQNNKLLRTKTINLMIDSFKFDYYCKTFSYLFILDESLLIENKIPFNISCKLSGSKEKEMYIRPLQQKEFLDIDQSKTSVQFSFNYHDKKFVSDIVNINELDKKNITNDKDYVSQTKQIKFFNEENKDQFIICEVNLEDSFNQNNLVGAFEKEYEQSLRSFQNKKKLVLYTKCLFVNKSDNLLYLVAEDEEKKEINPDDYNYKILPHSINLINVNDIKKPFKLKTEGSEWSNKFNINTVGNTGVLSLNLPDINNKDKVTILDMGINIPTSWYFTESLLITIVPRFIFMNKLGFDIEYKQYNNKINKEKNDNSDLFEKKELKNGESLNLNLLKGNKNMKKMLQIKFECSKDFSCPFDLEEMGEVDLKIEIDDNMKKKIEKKNEKIDKEIKRLKQLEEKKKKEELMKQQMNKEELAKKIENNNIMKENDDSDEEEEINPKNKDKKEDNLDNQKKAKDDKKELTPEEYKQKEIEEKNKLLEKYEIKPRKYILFKQNQRNYLLVHITKSTTNGLISIVLFPPKYPQYIISNESNHRLNFKQKKDEFNKELFYLDKNDSIPYVWGDSLRNEKALIVMLDKNDIELNLNEIKITKKNFETKEGGKKKTFTFYFQTLIENNKTRKLVIKNESIKNKARGYFLEVMKGKKKSVNFKFKFETKGLGISIINNEPKEIFYISAYGCTIEGNQFSFKKDECDHSITNVIFVLKNFQIDYCLEDNFKSMLIPLNPMNASIEEEAKKNNQELIPLIQGVVSFHSTTNPLTLVSSDEIPQIDMTMQPIKLNVSQFQLLSLMSLYQEIIPELDFFLVTPEPHEEYNNIEELLNSLFGENENKKNELIYEPKYYDKMLNLDLDTLPEQVIYESENHWMFFIKNIHIGSLEIIVTTRMDLTAFKDMLPSYLVGVISALGNALLHITDYKIKAATSLYSDVFTDVYSLSDTLYNTYYRQITRGLFRIVGSLDILGNPTGYASSIADGFMQIIEAPRKGLINGPLGFGEGIAKGFGGFVQTILSSSFDVVGKISGTLLASCEMLQGEKVFEELEEREPEHLLDGIYTGLKEGAKDLGKGIIGIVFKPYEGAKKEGVKGFFKGLGSGVLGAVVSPFTAIFRVTNNIFVGLKNTVNLFNPKIKTDRFRYPRTIEKAEGLKEYNEDKAIIQAILDYLKDYQGQEIIYYRQFHYFKDGLEKSWSYLILTNKCILVVYEAKEVVFKLLVNHISGIEVHREEDRSTFDIIFNLKDGSRDYIKTKDVEICTEFYLMFESSK